MKQSSVFNLTLTKRQGLRKCAAFGLCGCVPSLFTSGLKRLLSVQIPLYLMVSPCSVPPLSALDDKRISPQINTDACRLLGSSARLNAEAMQTVVFSPLGTLCPPACLIYICTGYTIYLLGFTSPLFALWTQTDSSLQSFTFHSYQLENNQKKH